MNNIDFKIDVDDRLLRADHAGGKLRRVIDTYREQFLTQYTYDGYQPTQKRYKYKK